MTSGTGLTSSDVVFADVSRLLAPRSIAVIGASDQPGNLGGAAVRFLRKFNAPCDIWPVNPGRSTVAGLTCYPSVAALPRQADLAVIAVPSTAVADVVRECAATGIKSGVAWAGGFVEGGEPGRLLQNALVEACRETGFTLLGPNCIGIIDTHTPMIASFASMMAGIDRLLPGNISIISQSGGMATVGQALAQQSGYGFRYMISVGNEAVVTVADFIRALIDDPLTKIIAVYLEGARDGEKIRRALQLARDARKPVIVMKGGNTAASAGAAAAHTGALVGERRIWDAVLRDCAAIQVESLEQLLDVAMQLSGSDLAKLPPNPGVAVITFGGGSGVLAADQCDRVGLVVPPLSPQTRAALQDVVPPLASTRNPIDLTPQAYSHPKWLGYFPQVLDIIASDPQIGTLFFHLGPMVQGSADLARIVHEFRSRTDKLVIVGWPLVTDEARAVMQAAGVHLFQQYSRPVPVIERLYQYNDALQPGSTLQDSGVAFDWAAQIPQPQPGTVISEHQCHEILAKAGLPVAAGQLAQSATEAVAAANRVGYPVVMKGISAAVTHRAAAGLLVLRIQSDEQVRDAYRTLSDRAAAKSVTLDGIYVQHMVEEGMELLVAALRDPQFGVMISLGAGGGMTELLDDVVVVPAPLDAAQVLRALRRLRILGKTRLGSIADAEALISFVVAFSHVAAAAPWRRFTLEINPIKWSGEQVTAVDGLLLIEEP